MKESINNNNQFLKIKIHLNLSLTIYPKKVNSKK